MDSDCYDFNINTNSKTMSKALEFIKKEYPFGIDKYPLNEINTARLMEAYHKHEMQQKAEKIKDHYKNGLRLFLQGIRDYERECGQAVCYDERECEEFVNIHLESTDAFDFNEIQKLLEQ